MYFLVVQEGLKDMDVTIEGAFKTTQDAKKYAEDEYEQGNGYIFTILSQNGNGQFVQILQAGQPQHKLVWKQF